MKLSRETCSGSELSSYTSEICLAAQLLTLKSNTDPEMCVSWHCEKAVPKYDDWEEIVESGKAELAKIMKGSGTGDLGRYKIRDGRTLDWNHELEVLAFYRPCLEVMKRYKQVAPKTKRLTPD